MGTGRFRLDKSVGSGSNSPFHADTSPAPSFITFRVHDDPDPTPVQGSLAFDIASSKYNLRWESWSDFQAWLAVEQETKAIELRQARVYPEYGHHRFVCSRKGTGGDKVYKRLRPEWSRKQESKKTGCECKLLVKVYPNSPIVLGNYSQEHNHPLGNANLRFTRINKETREYIAGLLRLKVLPEHILHLVHRGVYDRDDLFDDDLNDNFIATRNEFIQLKDIRAIQKAIEAETVRLHPDDGQSILEWVKRLDSKGHLLGFKAKSDPPPPNSGLDKNAFTLMVQTHWQRNIFQKYGRHLLCIDATHNTTIYENLNLTTLVVRDKWAHGIPVAWMLASSGTQATISYFLRLHRLRSPLTIPRNILTDFDPAQNQRHFHIPHEPELWELLKKWIRITDRNEFDKTWSDIKNLSTSAKFVAYLEKYWMPEHIVRMWSAVYRKDRNIFEACDTNMLIEAWHHVLKGKFLNGKRNRRLDHLLYILITEVIPYYCLKQRRQDWGFEGIDIQVKKRKEILKRSEAITEEDVDHIEDEMYLVRSQSQPSRTYEVDLATHTCTCLDYPLIKFCKHLCAVQKLFGKAAEDRLERPLFEKPVNADIDIASPDPESPEDVPSRCPDTIVTSPKKPRLLVLIAEKLELLGARLRRPRKTEPVLPLLAEFQALLDSMLDATDNGAILPSAQHVAPNTSEWRKTKAAMVMPPAKTRAKRAGDPAYGAGASSGSKAPKKSKIAQSTPDSIVPPTSQSTSQLPPAPLPPTPAQRPPALLCYPTHTAYPQPGPVPQYNPYMYYYPPSQG